MVIKR